MAKSELEVLIKARNTAKAEFDRLNGQVNKLKGTSGGLNAKLGEMDSKFRSVTGMSLGFATAAGAAGMAVQGLVRFLKESVEQTVAYATTVDNMSRLLGINTEETSRLIQASDDLFISQENLQTALLAATRKGIDVSIEGLKGLSEEYLKLAPGVERGKFLMDNFGRSGAEMGKLMEKGADGIQQATDAIAKNLVLTNESVQDINNYRRSVDNLEDSWQGVKYAVGSMVIPQLDLLLRNLTAGTDEIEAHAEAVRRANDQWGMNTMWHSMGLAKDKSAEFKTEIQKLNDEFYRSQDAAAAAEDGLYGLKDSVIPVNAYMSELTKQLIFNQAAAGLDAAASLELAKSMGMVPPTTELAMDRIAKWRKQLDDGTITLEEYTELVSGMGREINALPAGKDIVIRVRGEVDNSAREAASFTGQGRNAYIGLANSNRAGGGPASGLTWVGEQGPELVNLPTGSHVYTAPQSSRMAGGAVVNFYYSPALSLSDKTEAETKLIPIIRKALASV